MKPLIAQRRPHEVRDAFLVIDDEDARPRLAR
jgi:hypothetical protein